MEHQRKRRAILLFCLLLLIVLSLSVMYFIEDSKRIIIAIDPGHGGLDVGAMGVVNEADMNEKTAKYLHALLKKDKRFKPIFTRKFKTDVKYTLAERIKLSNKIKAKLLLSIHGNSSTNRSTKGFECYAVPPGRANHKDSVKFATIIAKKMGEAGHLLRGENGVRYMYYIETKGKAIRSDIREFSYTNTTRNEPSIAVVENPDCPSVLVEQCFVNNLEDYEAWGNEAGAQKSAQVYYESICAYFGL